MIGYFDVMFALVVVFGCAVEWAVFVCFLCCFLGWDIRVLACCLRVCGVVVGGWITHPEAACWVCFECALGCLVDSILVWYWLPGGCFADLRIFGYVEG